MTLKQKYSIAGVVAIISLALFVFSYSSLVKAAINMFSPTDCYTAAATTSPAFMTPGTGTSTVACNLGYEGARMATLLVEVNASSTNTTYNIAIEESMDGIDWFPISMNQGASTTAPFSLSVNGSLKYVFASSTIGQGTPPVSTGVGIDGTNNRNHVSASIPVNLKRVRVIGSLATTTNGTDDNGALWMQIVPKVDVN